MNIVGSLSALDPKVPGELVKIRRIGIAATACQQSATTVLKTPAPNEIGAEIAAHVRAAAGLLSTMMQIEANDQASNDVEEETAVWYSETVALRSSHLIGTIYDDILLWSLCVFSASCSQQPSVHTTLIQKILDGYGIQKWENLKSLLARYICPASMFQRLQRSSIDLM